MYDWVPMINKSIAVVLTCLVLSSVAVAQKRESIPYATLLLITKAEDERRWDDHLRNLFSHANAVVRKRAALAAGRIGSEDSVSALTNLMDKDTDARVRSM